MFKNINKTKLFLISALIAVTLFGIGSVALAQVEISGGLGATFGLGTQDFRTTLINIVNIALGFLGIIAITVILYGGFIWMTSGGRPDRIDKAKKILISAVIGLLIILFSFAIWISLSTNSPLALATISGIFLELE